MTIVFYIYFILITALACFNQSIPAGILSIFAICHVSLLYTRCFPSISLFLIGSIVSIFFISCVYLLHLYNKLIKIDFNNIDRDFQKQEEQLNLLIAKDKNLKERNLILEKSLNEIVKIYEYVKQLGSTMDFSSAIYILEKTLKSLTHFGNGKLILIENNDIKKVYLLSCGTELQRSTDVSSLKQYEIDIIHKLSKNPQILLYEKNKLTPLGRLPGNIETFLVSPLIVENQLVGFITLENIPIMNIDKIHFITLQFAMEVKKTQLYEKVKELSTFDSLTQLYLRRHFLNLLTNELDRGYRQDQLLSFLMMDIDFFKRYNDEYGHLVGDFILRKIGGILKEKSREIDILCRYGGDEFALVLPRTNLQDAQIVAERLRRAINEYLFQVSNEQFQVSISIGISSCNPKDMCLEGISETIIDLADKALYQAKSQGRNKVVLSL